MIIHRSAVRRKFRLLCTTKTEKEACRITALTFGISEIEVLFLTEIPILFRSKKQAPKIKDTNKEILDYFAKSRKKQPKVTFQKQTWLSGLGL